MANTKSTINNSNVSREDREERNAVKARKAAVLKNETKNFSCLIVWRSTKGWWKMCGHSALIYTHYVAPELLGNKKVQLHVDTDRYSVSTDGIVSIKDIEKFKADVTRVGLRYVPTYSTETVIFMALPKPLDAQAIDDMRIEEAGNRQKINEVLHANIKDQYLENELRKAINDIYHLVRKLDNSRHDFIGRKIYDSIIEIYQVKGRLNRDEISIEHAYRKILNHTNDISALIALGYELNFFSTERLTTLVQHLHNIRTSTDSKLRQMAEDREEAKLTETEKAKDERAEAEKANEIESQPKTKKAKITKKNAK